MKIKMVKMGSDYTTPINCRLRGIVVTPDNKHLFVEVGCAYSPDIRHTSLTQKEYNLKYPNPQYVSVDFCFRVDIPEDRYKNSTKEYSKYTRENFFEIPYTEKGIIKFLRKLNNEIDGIELVNGYYLDKYCEENGFYELYDDRLKHNYEILSIKYLDPDIKDDSNIIYKYTCYAVDGTEFSEIREEKDNIKNIVKKYGLENVKPLVLEYINKMCKTFTSIELKEKFNQLVIDVFETDKNENSLEMDNDYTDIWLEWFVMNVDIIEKPKKNISEDIKVSSSTDVLNLKDVQEIRNAIREHLLFIGLDNRNNVRNITLLGIGTSCNVVIDTKEIIRTALYSASDKVILVHNHPSNNLEPSKDDFHLTSVTNEMLKVFNIKLQDHIIVTEKDHISMDKIQKISKEKNIKSINNLKKDCY